MNRARKGSGQLRLRGRIWSIIYSSHGVRHEESSHSPRRSDAQKLLLERLAAAGNAPARRGQKIMVGELLDYLTRDYLLSEPRRAQGANGTALIYYFMFALGTLSHQRLDDHR